METNKLMAGIVATAIAVIVLAGVLMPALTDATQTHDVYSNVGYFDMIYTEDDNIDLSWDYQTPDTVIVNGKNVQPRYPNGLECTIICGDDWIVRYGLNHIILMGSNNYIDCKVSNEGSLSISASEGTAAIEYTTSGTSHTTSESYTYLYVVSDDGEFVMKESGQSAYVLGNSAIYAMGSTSKVGETGIGLKITGTIDDGFTGSVFRRTNVTIESVTPTYSAVDGHKDLYSISKIDLGLKNTSTDVTGSATYDYFIVPATVTAEKTVHLDPAMNTILNVIPILIIVAVLLGVVAIFIIRRE